MTSIYTLLIMVIVLSVPLLGEDTFSGLMMTQPNINLMIPSRKSAHPEATIEAIESHFIKDVFLKDLFKDNVTSILTEEEKDSIPESFQGGMEREIIIQAFADKLAKQDILHLKKLIKHEQSRQ